MRTRSLVRIVAGAASALLLAACAERSSPVGPSQDDVAGGVRGMGAIPLASTTAGTEECTTIDFSQYVHGQQVTTVSGFGVTFTVSATRWDDGAVGTARAYNSAGTSGPDPDLEFPSSPLGMMLVIEDYRGFPTAGDNNQGGTLTFTRTAGTEEVYIKSFVVADVEQHETPILLDVNGTQVASSPITGDDAYATASTTSHPNVQTAVFYLGGRTGQGETGSGAIDSIVLCRNVPNTEEPPSPPGNGTEGCTPGYWKQSHHFDSWVGYMPGQSFETVFGVNVPGRDLTLLQALQQGGGGWKALGRHAVAALLNASNSSVDYEYTTAEVIAIVQDAFRTGDFEAAKNLLAEENEEGCPLN